MQKRKMSKAGFVAGVVLFTALSGIIVTAVPDDAMEAMQKSRMTQLQEYNKNMKDLVAAMAAVDDAIKAIDTQNTATAKQQLVKVRKLLKKVHDSQMKLVLNNAAINDQCPISGKKINRMNTPESLTRMHKGQKVGFCCPECPPQWDKLTEAEKDAKLQEVTAIAPEKKAEM
jgi:hypothetical protein